MFRRILVPFDGSSYALRALTVALDLAKAADATVTAVAVVSLPEFAATQDEVEEAETRGRRFFQTALERAAELGTEAGVNLKTELLHGNRAEAILEYCQTSRADLIVLGRQGLSAVERYVLGSVSEAVVHHAPCSVLVVR